VPDERCRTVSWWYNGDLDTLELLTLDPDGYLSKGCGIAIGNVKMNGKHSETNYRWYVLALAALTSTLTVAAPTMCLPVLFEEIAEDLGLSLVQIGLVWGIGALPSIFTGLVGGAIGDRLGARRTLSVACLLVGPAGALRGLSNDLVTLAATMFLFGLTTPMIMMSLTKTCGIWFSRRQLGLANGVVAMGMAFGFMLGSMISATVLSPWLGGWRNVLFLYGAIAMAFSIPWYFSRSAPNGVEVSADETSPRSLRQTVSHVVRIWNMWLLGFVLLCIGGCVQGTLGYLALYLRGIGWPEASADGALATFHAVSTIFVVPIALWSDRLGSRKAVLVAAALMIITGAGLLSIVDGMMVWVAVSTAGMVRDGFMAIFMTMVLETEGVGATYASTAMGLMMVFSGVGSLVAPPLGNNLAQYAPGLPFTFWAALAAVGFLGLRLVKERGVDYAPATM
jgi:ACS family glucarate transporter-like MFS transporter